MTVATMTDSSLASYNAHHRTTLSHLRRTPTRALSWLFTLGVSVNLLVSTALRLTSNDARLFYPYSTVLLVISTAPALVMLFFGENTASRELAERYAGLTGRDIWRTHISTSRRMLVMSTPYALICAGCELIIAGGAAEPANIWSNFSAPIRWVLLPAIITLSYFLGASMGGHQVALPDVQQRRRGSRGNGFLDWPSGLQHAADSFSTHVPHRLSRTPIAFVADHILCSVHRDDTCSRVHHLPPADLEDTATAATITD